ncbi:MAG: DNA-deoxyinosine glycosylase [Clostridia bacterium]|nr:DNA-deoxyinosine glycosylase [Clostridia bacterium]
MRHVKHPFAPIIDKHCRVLLLGSVPSVKSVENEFYYMHPQNRFWKLMSYLLNEDFVSADIRTRTTLLLKHNIALYDSVEECDIEGSSDTKIKNVIPSDIPSFLEIADIQHIFCNGAASYQYLTKFYPEYQSIATKLPSTSPANAKYTIPMLADEWNVILSYNK